jgi:hypothetical protein
MFPYFQCKGGNPRKENLHISAKEYATARDSKQMPNHDQTMTGGPPASMPTINVPPKAVQQVTMEKLKPTIPRREKERLSSVNKHNVRLPGIFGSMGGGHHTLLIAQLGELDFILNSRVKSLVALAADDRRKSSSSHFAQSFTSR